MHCSTFPVSLSRHTYAAVFRGFEYRTHIELIFCGSKRLVREKSLTGTDSIVIELALLLFGIAFRDYHNINSSLAGIQKCL